MLYIVVKKFCTYIVVSFADIQDENYFENNQMNELSVLSTRLVLRVPVITLWYIVSQSIKRTIIPHTEPPGTTHRQAQKFSNAQKRKFLQYIDTFSSET